MTELLENVKKLFHASSWMDLMNVDQLLAKASVILKGEAGMLSLAIAATWQVYKMAELIRTED